MHATYLKARSRGFTLIELLVVIAIIGILSAVVLASLNSARDKGGDAAIQSDLGAIRTQAEIYRDGPGLQTYGADASDCVTGMFVDDTTIANAILAANTSNGAGTVTCNSDGESYAVSAQLVADPAKSWCIDSTGVATSTLTVLGADVACL